MLGRALPLRDSSGKIIKWFGTCTVCYLCRGSCTPDCSHPRKDVHETVEALYASRKSQAQLASVINHANVTLWAVDKHGIITVAEGPGLKSLKLGGSPSGSVDGSTTSSSTSRTTSEASLSHFSQGSMTSDGSGAAGSVPQSMTPIEVRSTASARSHGTSHSRSFAPHRNGKMISTPTAPATMVGRSIYDLWDPEVKQHVERALHGDTITREMELEGRWYRTFYTPIREREMYRTSADVMSSEATSSITGVVGASLDITEIKRAAQMMEEAKMEKLRAISAETAAKEASRLKGEFLANMSHEIR
jgi:PAS domain-containing protein